MSNIRYNQSKIGHLYRRRQFKKKIKDYRMRERLVCERLFNDCEFILLKDLIKNMNLQDKEKENCYRFIDFYMYWNNMDYNKVVFYEFRPFPKLFKSVCKQYQVNVKGWNRLKNYDYEFRLIIDLINKSRRFSLQKKYDEAILCIYRACELIAKQELWEQYRLKPENMSVDRLTKLDLDLDFIDNISANNRFHHVNLSLKLSMELLYHLNDRIGQFFYINRFDFNDIINMRHHCLLIHGTEKISDIQYKKYDYLVSQLVKLFDSESEKLLSMTEFPYFE